MQSKAANTMHITFGAHDQQNKNQPAAKDDPGPSAKKTAAEGIKFMMPAYTGVERIISKLKAGRRLTGSELTLLRRRAPQYYARVLMVRSERSQYPKRLKACRSKAEARSLYGQKQLTFLVQGQALERSALPAEEKEQERTVLAMRQAAITDEQQAFTRSRAYQRLPESPPRPAWRKTSGPKNTFGSVNYRV
jgi:hypothetical protein